MSESSPLSSDSPSPSPAPKPTPPPKPIHIEPENELPGRADFSETGNDGRVEKT